MVNKLLEAITKQLYETFGFTCYIEDVNQDLTRPCFTVDMLQPTERSRSKILYNRTMPVVVHYFPLEENNVKNDCYNMAESALECLEYLNFLSKLLRAEDISWHIVDNVLEIFMTYNFETAKILDPYENMEQLFQHYK